MERSLLTIGYKSWKTVLERLEQRGRQKLGGERLDEFLAQVHSLTMQDVIKMQKAVFKKTKGQSVVSYIKGIDPTIDLA